MIEVRSFAGQLTVEALVELLYHCKRSHGDTHSGSREKKFAVLCPGDKNLREDDNAEALCTALVPG
jgi:hypothetical protein